MTPTITNPRGAEALRVIVLAMMLALIAPHAGAIAAPGGASAQGAGQDRFIVAAGDEIVITNVKIIDGTGAAPREGQSVLVRDGRIAEIGAAGSVRASMDAEVIDGSGRTLIPGLVGLHNHSYYTAAGGRAAQLSTTGPIIYLASGVTTIRTTGARAPYEELNLQAAIEAGRRIGPRIFVTGPYLTGQRGSMTMAQLNGEEDARRIVRYWAEEGVSWFKAYTQISREELGAAIDEAHENGIKVTAHLCSVTFREAVALGIDQLEHGLLTNTDYMGEKQPDQCIGIGSAYLDLDMNSEEVQQTFRDMIDADVGMTSTLAVYENFVLGRPPVEQRALDMLAPEIAAAVKAENDRYVHAPEDADIGFPPEMFQKALEYEAAFVRAGGTLAAGVDPTGYGAALPGFGDQRNFELLREADFSPQEVVRIMSANGAKILGIDDETGTLEVGKLAEMVLLEGDLADDPAVIKNVAIVFKDGVGYDSPAMLESIKGQVGIH
jgi:imidazolonepropionase-like amidohydrolase